MIIEHQVIQKHEAIEFALKNLPLVNLLTITEDHSKDGLTLNFDGKFWIHIYKHRDMDKPVIRMERIVYRPNHDHNDIDELRYKNDKLSWYDTDYEYDDKMKLIPKKYPEFGPITVQY